MDSETRKSIERYAKRNPVVFLEWLAGYWTTANPEIVEMIDLWLELYREDS